MPLFQADNYDRWWIGNAAQGLTGVSRWWLGPMGRRVVPLAAAEDDDDDDTATRSQEGHIVSVVGGFIFM